MENNKAISTQVSSGGEVLSPFSSIQSFEAVQRMAQALSRSSMVPEQFHSRQGDGGQGIANTLLAFQLASRLKADVFMVMQNAYIIHGKPSFSSAFIIATINSCGRFNPLRFEYQQDATGALVGCKAWTEERKSGIRLDGPTVTLEMARAEGWLSKSGSKWKTMPEQMLAYRAASFWSRLYAPEVILGMHSTEEMEDSGDVVASSSTVAELNSMVAEPAEPVQDAEVVVEVPQEKSAVEELNLVVEEVQENAGV